MGAPGRLIDCCAAFLPPEAGGPDPEVLAGCVAAYLDRTPHLAAAAIHAGAAVLSTYSVVTTGRRLRRLDPERRDAVLRQATSRPETALAVDGLKTVLCLVHGATGYADEILAWGTRFPPARPDDELDVTPSWEWPASTTADVVVVGSGAGGAFAARTLARAGLDVIIVEEGRRATVDGFREGSPLERWSSLYRDAGTTIALGLPPVALPVGRGVGGTTLVNSGTCYRPPRRVLQRWCNNGMELADPDALDPILEDVEATLQVAPASLDVIGNNARHMLRGAERLGWAAAPLRRNGPGCVGSCQCALGCPRNAKFGVHLNALPQACGAGARIVSRARVTRVIHESGRAGGVVAVRGDGSRLTVLAPRVLIAAGATETPPLLRRSGLGRHPMMGRNLSIHPALGVAGRFEEDVTAWHGVLQSAAVEEFHEDEGILIEATATPPGMGSMSLPGHGTRLVGEMADAARLVTLGAMIGDEPNGRVLGTSRAVPTYRLSRRDAGRLLRAVEHMADVLFAAGATEVLTGLHHAPAVRSMHDLRNALPDTDVRGLHLAAFHPSGTAAAGDDMGRQPCDPQGRLRGVDGVWLADASVLPSCPEVNPQVTIMAVAQAIADGIVASDTTGAQT